MSNFDLQKKSVNARFLDFFFAQVAGVHLCILMFAEIAVTFKTRWLIFHVKEAVPRKLYYFCIFPTKIFCCNILGYKKIEKESHNKMNVFYFSLFHKNLKSDTIMHTRCKKNYKSFYPFLFNVFWSYIPTCLNMYEKE